mmetsp:Transcript_46227/g.114639  ORF Transcript_46227/g.114639 Transcript_46227/m.114639 type:complete len:234 (-) Transcript_46227:220-921(-)
MGGVDESLRDHIDVPRDDVARRQQPQVAQRPRDDARRLARVREEPRRRVPFLGPPPRHHRVGADLLARLRLVLPQRRLTRGEVGVLVLLAGRRRALRQRLRHHRLHVLQLLRRQPLPFRCDLRHVRLLAVDTFRRRFARRRLRRAWDGGCRAGTRRGARFLRDQLRREVSLTRHFQLKGGERASVVSRGDHDVSVYTRGEDDLGEDGLLRGGGPPRALVDHVGFPQLGVDTPP